MEVRSFWAPSFEPISLNLFLGAYGGKKFSYFTSGSGPYGSYQKGYYGSDGYEHDDHKSKYSSHNEDNGFKKGYDGAGAGHDDKYTSYDKVKES